MASELSGSSTTSTGSPSSTSTGSSRPRTWSRSRTCSAPTSRVPSLPRERGARAGAPTPPTAPSASRPRGRESAELLELTVAEALRRIEAGELASDEYFDAYAEAAAGDELNAYLWRAEPGARAPPGEPRTSCAASRSPSRTSSAPRAIPTTAGSRILEGYRPPYTATAVARLAEAGAPRARQDQHGRVRDGLLERELRLRAGAQPLGPRRGCPAAPPAARRPPSPGGWRLGDRHRHRRLDPPAGVALRDRRPEAHLRRDLALRDDRLRLLARPVRAADPRRHRRGAAAAARCRAATMRLDLGRDRGRGRAALARGPRGASASASRASSPTTPRGSRPASPRLRAAPGLGRGARRRESTRSSCRTPSTGSRPTT